MGEKARKRRCTAGRVSLAAGDKRFLWAMSGGHCCNPTCRRLLFSTELESRLTFGQLAHIVAAMEGGPRGEAEEMDAEERAAWENIVLLCSICHTMVDGAPDEFPVDELREWQRTRMVELESSFGALEYPDRTSARADVEGTLATNRFVFERYGPEARKDAGDYSADGALLWRRKMREVILPGNRRVLAIADKNRHLLQGDERETVEALRAHIDDLEGRHFRGLAESGSERFPESVDLLFAE